MNKVQDIFEKVLVCLGFPVVLLTWCLYTVISWPIRMIKKLVRKGGKE